jgi:type III pantothenate kinase
MIRGIKKEDIEGVIVCSVVPQIMYSLERACRDYFGKMPILVDRKTDLDMRVLIDNPAELGADRLVNAFAAREIYGGPLIIVDFGTATTFCAVSREGDYLGGAICPGIKISIDALFSNTSKLPRIEIAKPENVIGKTTEQSMQSGVLFGYVGQVLYLVNKFKDELGADTKAIGTGGLARMISDEADVFHDINPHLTLEGLRRIYILLTR